MAKKVKKAKRGMKEGLLKRIREGQARKEGMDKSFFREDLPKEILFWKCDEKDHLIDIIPYFAGANDPVTPEGEETYVLEVYVHRDAGVMDGSIICLAETFGRPCPICEDRKKRQMAGEDDDVVKSLTPSRFPRSIYNILCWDSTTEEEKGVQVWHTSNYLMEQHLLELAKVPVRKGRKGVEPFLAFMDPEEGKSVAFTRKGKKENTKYIGHRFADRDYTIPAEVLEQAYCLDELIHIPTYDELYVAYYGPDMEEEEEGISRKKRIRKPLKGKKGVRAEVEEEEELEEEEVEEESEEEEEHKKKVLKKKKVVEEEEEEEEEPEEEGEEGVCPADGTFGVDIDQLEECEECDQWTACAKEERRLEEEEEEQPQVEKKKGKKKVEKKKIISNRRRAT